ncbi:MAG TPA: hypothetical protein VMY98_08590 [Anaerolineae bacterium]|nr:hypothetical protein [Anaerolineae bacterium]
MAVCWVKAGVCNNEATIKACKAGESKVTVSVTTTCEFVAALAKALPELDLGVEMTRPLHEMTVCALAAEHLCLSSCIMPAAILKALEVAAGLFVPGKSHIEFIAGAL